MYDVTMANIYGLCQERSIADLYYANPCGRGLLEVQVKRGSTVVCH